MQNDREQQVRERAYALWEQAGKPEGKADDYWQQAEREIGGEDDTHDPDKRGPLVGTSRIEGTKDSR